jgi:hypothetical protein
MAMLERILSVLHVVVCLGAFVALGAAWALGIITVTVRRK